MRVLDENLLLLSATDLVYFLGCHATVEVPGEGFDPSRENRGTQEPMGIGAKSGCSHGSAKPAVMVNKQITPSSMRSQKKIANSCCEVANK
jgi:hypothetical protein